MLFSIGVVIGLVAGGVLLIRAPRRFAGWLAAALGLAALVVFAAGWLWDVDLPPFAMPLAIALPFAALLFNIGSLVRGDRAWSNWLGMVLSAAPGLFWIFFAVAEIAGPPH